MGTEIDKVRPVVEDITKPWRRQFFECKDIGKEPPINVEGFWKKPEHGIPIKEKGGR